MLECFAYQPLPKFIPLRQNGLTLTDALGESRRYRPKGLLGEGGDGMLDMLCTMVSSVVMY